MTGCQHVFNLAADMGGMGFIQSNHSVIMYNNTMISFNMLEAARVLHVKRYGSKATGLWWLSESTIVTSVLLQIFLCLKRMHIPRGTAAADRSGRWWSQGRACMACTSNVDPTCSWAFIIGGVMSCSFVCLAAASGCLWPGKASIRRVVQTLRQ